MKITLIGTGFVGVVSAAVYASLGHQVKGLDVDEEKISKLQKGQTFFYEPNLKELLKTQLQTGNLKFTTSYTQAIADSEIIIIAVGTPSAPDGQADLKYVLAAAESMAPHLQSEAIVIVKSTVPPGTLDKISQVIKAKTKTKFYTASLPEFLKEGSAVQDTLRPDRVVIGAKEKFVFDKLEKLHQPFKAPIIKISPNSAQMAKYTANAYLATRITFINQIADLCEKNGADIQEVISAIGQDQRIGTHYWYPGFGYGGSCFPKDVKELAAYSRAISENDNLLNKVNDLNEVRIPKLLKQYAEQIGGWENKQVAVLGLSFKPSTNDMREAPATKVIPLLLAQGAKIKSYDPMAKWADYPPVQDLDQSNHQQVATLVKACQQADVIIALVEWPEIIAFEFSQVRDKTKKQWLIDARNQLNPKQIKQAGFNYIGLGRKKL